MGVQLSTGSPLSGGGEYCQSDGVVHGQNVELSGASILQPVEKMTIPLTYLSGGGQSRNRLVRPGIPGIPLLGDGQRPGFGRRSTRSRGSCPGCAHGPSHP